MDWSSANCNSKINSVSWSSIYDNLLTDKKAIKKELQKMKKMGQINYNSFDSAKVNLKINNLSGKNVKFEHVDAFGNLVAENQYFGAVPMPRADDQGDEDDEDYDYNNTGSSTYTNYGENDENTENDENGENNENPFPSPQEDQPPADSNPVKTKNRYPQTFYTYEKHLWLVKNARTNQNLAMFYSRKQNTCKTWILTIKSNAELELEGDQCQDMTSSKHVQIIVGDKKIQRFLDNPKVKTFGQGDRIDFQVDNQMVDEVDVYWVDYDARQIKY